MSIGGLVAGAYGFLFWSIANSSTYNDSPYDSGADDVARNFGLLCFAVAAVLEGVGLPLLFSSTSVQVR